MTCARGSSAVAARYSQPPARRVAQDAAFVRAAVSGCCSCKLTLRPMASDPLAQVAAGCEQRRSLATDAINCSASSIYAIEPVEAPASGL